MKVVAICFLLLAASSLDAAQQQPYYGSTASSVLLPDPVERSDSDRITIHQGDIITPENVRQSIEALYATRHYQSIDVEAAVENGGVALTFRTQPFYFLSGIRLEPAKLLDRPLMSFIRVPLGAKFSTPVIDRLVESTRALLESQGYFDARIKPTQIFDKEQRLASIVLVADVQTQARISTVQVDGGERTFSNKELLDALNLKAGDAYTLDKLEEGMGRMRQKFSKLGFLNTQIDVQSPYDKATNTVSIRARVEPGQFAYVSVRDPKGDPIKEVSKDDLRKLMPIFEEGVVDQDLIAEGEQRLARFMRQQGFFNVKVTSERVDALQNDAVQITYTVDKGQPRRLGAVQIQGARHFMNGELRDAISLRSTGGQAAGVFSADQLAADIETMKTMYRNNGYFDVSIHAAQQEDTANQSVDVRFEIDEGPQYAIENLTFAGAASIPESVLRRTSGLSEGMPYIVAGVNAGINNLVGLYHSRGYADARIAVEREFSGPESVNLTVRITEGSLYQIGDIIVSGNTITATKIVRRRSLLQTGKPFFDEVVLAEQHRLYATGLFNRVQIIALDDERGPTRNLMIYIEDSTPIVISYGFGYREFDGFRGTFEISHSNLWGLSRALSSRLRLGQREQSFQASYREPHLFNRNNIGGFASFFIEKAQRRYFTASTVDFSIQTVAGVAAHSNLLLTASYQTVNLQDALLNPAVGQFPDAIGIIQIARVSASLVQDDRDDAVDPHRGTFRTTTFQVASKALGSEVNFTSIYNQTVFYKPLSAQVLAISSRIGWKHPYGGDTAVPISERYFAGGSTSLRGFSLDELRAGGGQLLTIGNVEYRASFYQFQSRGLGGVIFRSLGGALFYDTGNVFVRPSNFTLREFTHTVGSGLRAMTPLGPIRLDVGVNLAPQLRLKSDGQLARDKRVRVFLTLGNAF